MKFLLLALIVPGLTFAEVPAELDVKIPDPYKPEEIAKWDRQTLETRFFLAQKHYHEILKLHDDLIKIAGEMERKQTKTEADLKTAKADLYTATKAYTKSAELLFIVAYRNGDKLNDFTPAMREQYNEWIAKNIKPKKSSKKK